MEVSKIMGVTPVIIHFFHGIFCNKNHPAIGVPASLSQEETQSLTSQLLQVFGKGTDCYGWGTGKCSWKMVGFNVKTLENPPNMEVSLAGKFIEVNGRSSSKPDPNWQLRWYSAWKHIVFGPLPTLRGFLSHGGTPKTINFVHGIFCNKNHPAIGVTPFMEPLLVYQSVGAVIAATPRVVTMPACRPGSLQAICWTRRVNWPDRLGASSFMITKYDLRREICS